MSHIRVPPTLEAAQAVAPATTAFFAPREENDLEEDLEENLEDDPEELDLEKKPPLGLPPFLPRTTTRRRAIRRNQSNFIFSWKSFNGAFSSLFVSDINCLTPYTVALLIRYMISGFL